MAKRGTLTYQARGLDDIEDEFKKMAEEVNSKYNKKSEDEIVAEDYKEEQVTKKFHDEKVKELKEKIESLEDKNKELKKEKKSVSDELDKLKKSYTSLKNTSDQVKEKYDKKVNDFNKLDTEYKALKKSTEKSIPKVDYELQEKNEQLKKDIKNLEKKYATLEKENLTLKEENDSLKSKCESLEKDIVSNSASKENLDYSKSSIFRISPDTFQSPLFTGTTYKVKISTDASSISFEENFKGKCVCSDNKISIPSLPKYLNFYKEMEYPVEISNGVMKIMLK